MEFYQEPEVNRLHSVISWIVDLIVAVALAIYVVYAFGERVEMYGGSMNPVLNSGDVVLVNRLAYDLGSPERFDIAVFTNGSSMNIKRIIGLPGETVQITGNTIHIDGRPLTADHDLDLASIAGLAESPIELSGEEYFLLGDNRESSEDSRFSGIGNVQKNQLVGRVWLRFQPFSRFGLLPY